MGAGAESVRGLALERDGRAVRTSKVFYIFHMVTCMFNAVSIRNTLVRC